MENPKDLKYTKDHEWVRVEGNKAIIGVTDVAQSLMGDVVFVELPEVGAEYSTGEAAANIESVKAVSEVFAPVGGKIAAVNAVLEDTPELINKEAFGEGWIFTIEMSDAAELDNLLSVEEYGKLLVEGE
ncbi:glycine cleavage system protein GcvH [Phosphitispora fastidiosa]|uniref:glycine cleavage system protein GcvH n=1 Tax=Phosphitispora fastidiosa TaxID=2837202 RepID=UPI001E48076F|nr:glycine cleavage system protein GcvH [Phosphitispora fastidiosa]MBU7005759.1 glycine cleavage system H protein [Phosphitispora fastidiosa]